MGELLKLLSSPQTADMVMQTLASYVIYVYPGILSIYWFNFLNARTTKNTQAFLAKSFAISYLYNICLKTSLKQITFEKTTPNEKSIIYNAILIIGSFVFPYVWHRVKQSKLSIKICEWLKIDTSIVSVPFELISDKEEQYTCLKVYLTNSPYIYIGYLEQYEYEEEHEKYVILTGYRKYCVESDLAEKEILTFDSEDYREKVLIKFDDIRLIEKLEEKRAKKLYMEKVCKQDNQTNILICLQKNRKFHRRPKTSRKCQMSRR